MHVAVGPLMLTTVGAFTATFWLVEAEQPAAFVTERVSVVLPGPVGLKVMLLVP